MKTLSNLFKQFFLPLFFSLTLLSCSSDDNSATPDLNEENPETTTPEVGTNNYAFHISGGSLYDGQDISGSFLTDPFIMKAEYYPVGQHNNNPYAIISTAFEDTINQGDYHIISVVCEIAIAADGTPLPVGHLLDESDGPSYINITFLDTTNISNAKNLNSTSGTITSLSIVEIEQDPPVSYFPGVNFNMTFEAEFKTVYLGENAEWVSEEMSISGEMEIDGIYER